MRRFYSYGPVDCEEHFCVERRLMVACCLDQLIGNPESRSERCSDWVDVIPDRHDANAELSKAGEKISTKHAWCLRLPMSPLGLEPRTHGLKGRCSAKLS